MISTGTKAMLGRIARKAVWMLLVLWGITIVSFIVIHLAPGSPTDLQTTLNPMAGEAARERLEALYGINRPLHVQYFDWLSRVLQLDFGNSMSSDARPVMEKIAERLPLTVGINVVSLALTLLIAVPVGVLSAWKQGSLFDKAMTVLVFLGFAMPGFWLALLLMLYTGLEHQWLPISGLASLDYASLSPWGKVFGPCPASGPARHGDHGGKRGRDVPFHAFLHAGSPAAGFYPYRQSQGAPGPRDYFPPCAA